MIYEFKLYVLYPFKELNRVTRKKSDFLAISKIIYKNCWIAYISNLKSVKEMFA